MYVFIFNLHTMKRYNKCILYKTHLQSGRMLEVISKYVDGECTQRRVQPDQCYFIVQITGINFEYSM